MADYFIATSTDWNNFSANRMCVDLHQSLLDLVSELDVYLSNITFNWKITGLMTYPNVSVNFKTSPQDTVWKNATCQVTCHVKVERPWQSPLYFLAGKKT